MSVRREGLLLLCLAFSACRPRSANAAPLAARAADAGTPATLEQVYLKELKPGWFDFGWAQRKEGSVPAQHKLAGYSGWILARAQPTRAGGGVLFTWQAPEKFGDFLRVQLKRTRTPDNAFPPIDVTLANTRPLPNGWKETFVPMTALNPQAEEWDQIVINAWKKVGDDWVTFDNVAVTLPDASSPAAAAKVVPPAPRSLAIDCRAPTHQINPLVYGIAYYVGEEYNGTHQWQLGATARRWGGNQTTRYNWKLGNAWSAGNDWYFRNLDYVGPNKVEWANYLQSTSAHGMVSTVTVPIAGWVAKDTSSCGFPEALFPEQESIEGSSHCGNGKRKDGSLISPPPPGTSSIPSPPDFVAQWVKAMLADDKARGRDRPVRHYILDNEPALWNATHRDMHPEPLGYDELLQRTIDYGSAVRKADPQAVIAGPAEWGWTNYFTSAVDRGAPRTAVTDRMKHLGTALVPWYLSKVKEHDQKTGVKVLDILDLHFYPQGPNIGISMVGDVSNDGRARRIRSTRALWDPTYKDESWINEPVMLIPRMQKWVADNYPGLGTSIGEWNFGAEGDISGGLAVAEALGRFGQQNLTSAYYWSYPAKDSPAFYAFRAFRNYDGQGAHFQDWSLPSTAPEGLSMFASVSKDRTVLTAVVLNLDPKTPANASFALGGCGTPTATRAFRFGKAGLEPATFDAAGALALPPYTFAVVEWTMPKGEPSPK